MAAMADKHDDKKAGDKTPASVMENQDKQKAGEEKANKKGDDEAQVSGKLSGAFYAADVIGNNIKHRGTDEDVGEVNDLIIDEDGQIVGVVVTTSGFLGLDGQDAGLSWKYIEHSMEDEESVFYTEMDEEALRNLPKYERD
ncbi:MAG: PRC-barrel domain-containing protein [Pseudomonadota bacterium]